MNASDQIQADYLVRLSTIVQMDAQKIIRANMVSVQMTDNN